MSSMIQLNPSSHFQTENEQKMVCPFPKDKIQAEYIWIGGSGEDLRSKCKTINIKGGIIKHLSELPEWNFDGSSTKQASGDNSEVWLKPVKFVPDPFRKYPNILVLCECVDAADTNIPIQSNTRHDAMKIFEDDLVKDEKPWYGLEQEYTMFEADNRTPLGWPTNGYPAPQGPYYCGVGAGKAIGRNMIEEHYNACLYSGLQISGINSEVMPGQWEFQIGPVESIDAADQLWISRYLLLRVCEEHNVCVSFQPKPVSGDWNGAGLHTNFSTKSMRQKGGYDEIIKGIENLGKKHSEHMDVYGIGNKKRLTGSHETAKWDSFKYGVADRGASVRIPRQTFKDQCGYFEDRRPAANCDPYVVTAVIAESVLLQST